MGQDDVYQYLKKCKGKWLTSKEIGDALKIGQSSISTSLKRLRASKMVRFKGNPCKKGTYLYRGK